MPEFTATLLATAAFCATLMLLNALTRCLLQAHLAPHDLCENGFVQYGGALLVARVAYQRVPVR